MTALDVVLVLIAVLLFFAVVTLLDLNRTADGVTKAAAEKAERTIRDKVAAKDVERTARIDASRTADAALQRIAELEALIPPPRPALTPEQIEAMKAETCRYCGAIHDINQLRDDVNCPRVRRIRFRPDGSTPWEVEFWFDWPTDRVTYLEDILPTAEEPVTG